MTPSNLTDAQQSIVRQFGFPPAPDFTDEQLAARVLEFPNTDSQWYVGAAVTLAAALIAAAQKLRQMDEALKPFAAEAAEWDDLLADDDPMFIELSAREPDDQPSFTVGDLRAARRARTET